MQLQHVLLKPCHERNLFDATKDGARILQVKSGVDDEGVIVSVADTGTGINSEVVDRILEPLFTTKSDGMGMGLSICRLIIEGYDGRLWFDPNKPEWATFRFKLFADSSTTTDASRGNQVQQM